MQEKSLTEFIWDYIQDGHDYISKVIISGMYIDKINPKSNLNENFDKKRQRGNIIRKTIPIFAILRHLGIIEKFSKNTVRVKNRDKLKEIGLDKLLTYNVKDFQNYKKN